MSTMQRRDLMPRRSDAAAVGGAKPAKSPVPPAAASRAPAADRSAGVSTEHYMGILKQKLDEQRRELEQRTDAVNAVQRNFESLSSMYSKDKSEWVSAVARSKALEDEIAALRAEVKVSKCARAELSQVQDELGRIRENDARAHAAHAARGKELEAERDAAARQAESARRNLTQEVGRVKELRAARAEAEAAADAVDSAVQQLAEVLAGTLGELGRADEARAVLHAPGADSRNLAARLRAVASRCTQWQESGMCTVHAGVSDMAFKLRDLEAKMRAAQDAEETAKAEAEARGRRERQAASNAADETAKCCQLRVQVSTAEKAAAQLRSELKEMTARADEMDRARKAAEAAAAEAGTQAESLRGEAERLRADAKAAADAMQAKDNAMNALRDAHTELQVEAKHVFEEFAAHREQERCRERVAQATASDERARALQEQERADRAVREAKKNADLAASAEQARLEREAALHRLREENEYRENSRRSELLDARQREEGLLQQLQEAERRNTEDLRLLEEKAAFDLVQALAEERTKEGHRAREREAKQQELAARQAQEARRANELSQAVARLTNQLYTTRKEAEDAARRAEAALSERSRADAAATRAAEAQRHAAEVRCAALETELKAALAEAQVHKAARAEAESRVHVLTESSAKAVSETAQLRKEARDAKMQGAAAQRELEDAAERLRRQEAEAEAVADHRSRTVVELEEAHSLRSELEGALERERREREALASVLRSAEHRAAESDNDRREMKREREEWVRRIRGAEEDVVKARAKEERASELLHALQAVQAETAKAIKKLVAAEEACESGYSCLSCLELVRTPVMCVPCGHTYCRQCVAKPEKGSRGRCPECDDATVERLVPLQNLELLCGKFIYRKQVLHDLYSALEREQERRESIQL